MASYEKYWKLIQQHLGVDADGIPGARRLWPCWKSWTSANRNILAQPEDVRSGKSVFGRAGDESNMTSIKLPYVMRLAWETNTTVSTMRCHKLVAERSSASSRLLWTITAWRKSGNWGWTCMAAASTTAPLSAEKPHPCMPGASPWTWIRTETD
ncbi:MAG: hypothetical protein ACLT38_08495 [Akkermansia sp.]